MKFLNILLVATVFALSTAPAEAGGRRRHAQPQGSAQVDQGFERFRAACEEQAAKRRALGLENARAQFGKNQQGLPTCHVDGGMIERGKI